MSILPKTRYSKRILEIAYPAIAGMSSQMVVSVIDTAMVGRLQESSIALAAMGLGVLATWTITSFFTSLGSGTHILVARREGEGRFAGAGAVLNNSLAVSLVLGLVFGVLGYFYAYEFISLLSSDDGVAIMAGDYIKWRSIGLPFFLVTVSYRGFFYGIGHTKVFMYSAIVSYVFNIIFNFLLIFGNFGFPKMGVAGAGLAASIGMILGFFFFLFVTFLKDYRIKYRYYDSLSIGPKHMGPIVRISIPVAFQNILILFGFLMFVAVTGMIGTLEQASTQVVITALFLSFMPCFGFGIAAQTLVGNSLGEHKPNEAATYGIETAKLATIFTILLGIAFVAIPELILKVITNNDQVIAIATPLLRLAGLAQVVYGSGIILAYSLQAAGATVFVMYTEVITHWLLFLPVSYIVGVLLGNGIMGAWIALPVYVIAYSGTMWYKFMRGSWKTIRV
jgi:multidrug resistance protein, MATE family